MDKTNKELVKCLFFSIYLKYKDIYLKPALNKLFLLLLNIQL